MKTLALCSILLIAVLALYAELGAMFLSKLYFLLAVSISIVGLAVFSIGIYSIDYGSKRLLVPGVLMEIVGGALFCIASSAALVIYILEGG